MANTCPCCKRPYKAASSASGPEKKYRQDVARAEEAITILRCHVQNGGFAGDTQASNSLRVEAAQIEIMRLENAIRFPAILWRIYRRADKGPSYGTAPIVELEVAA
jgi:hypothetical protein